MKTGAGSGAHRSRAPVRIPHSVPIAVELEHQTSVSARFWALLSIAASVIAFSATPEVSSAHWRARS
jgi:hypothetical protein